MRLVEPHKGVSVSLLALPEGTPFALYGLYEVFSSVGVAWPELTGEDAEAVPMSVYLVGPTRETFDSAGHVPITPHRAMAEINATDLVIVPDLAVPLHADPRGSWPAAVEWVRRQYDNGATICSVCSGSLLLAEAGLLDGCEATTHWAFADLFARHYPQVRLRLDRILVPARDDQRIVTSGGASSWEDMVLYLVARFCGQAEAVRITKLFLFGDRGAGQLPFAALTKPREHGDAAIHAAQAWIADHYGEDNPVQRMAASSGLAMRTFKRRFAAATGLSPLAYVQALRVEEAKHLLERTDLDPETIAEEVGYSDPTFFRRLFRRLAGITPAQYRRRFRPAVAAIIPIAGSTSPTARRSA